MDSEENCSLDPESERLKLETHFGKFGTYSLGSLFFLSPCGKNREPGNDVEFRKIAITSVTVQKIFLVMSSCQENVL